MILASSKMSAQDIFELSFPLGWKNQPLNFYVCISPHLWPPDGWMGDIIRSAASWEQQETIICQSSTFHLFSTVQCFSPLCIIRQLPPVLHFSPPFLFLTPSVPSPAAGLACQPILTHSPVSLSLCSEYTKHPEPLMRVNERGQMGEGDQCDHLSYVWIDSPDSPGYLGRSGLIWVDLPAFADWWVSMENLNGYY